VLSVPLAHHLSCQHKNEGILWRIKSSFTDNNFLAFGHINVRTYSTLCAEEEIGSARFGRGWQVQQEVQSINSN